MINKLCLGTAQFGSVPYGISNITGKVDDQTLKSILECCIESNIHTLDTASAYGDSQARIGRCSFYNWHIISKVPRLRGLESDQIKSTLISIVQKSLTDLHVDSLDTLLIHDSKDLASSSSDLIYTSLLELKEAGIVKSIGVSIYTPDDFYSISPDYKLDIVQAPWNVFDQSLCTSGLVDDLNRLNIKIATTNTNKLFHIKMGLFIDEEEDYVAFSGSQNESQHSVEDAFEGIDVYTSWEDTSRAKKKRE